ncbi:transcriptional regulator FeaR [Metapseudomonas furukawaii]|jgi:AraC family transcriptional activator of tynA and feaB|uniref:Transcriptional activator feaR n=1 Tax=Metapseudomonas furukawaii TaxID=1149133 RepID=A0AAD1FFB4_METFU|nr:transcriptional regulator FeaR [Pseudomonas furukawaii]ELS25526.1 transcriptional regulator, AraC family [Pseudomonas furukawaii]WAG76774.1 transcriptional regulator FeaR [Pseudomonas furukawaii]BAU74725.1 transcriptional activator feaR [Pseudomonas furukawaii]
MTTAQAQRADRFDEWLQGINRVCGRFGAKCLGSEFSGSIREHKAGAIKLSFVDVSQARLFRTPKEVAQTDGKHFYLAFQLSGRAGMEQAGNRIEMSPGDITLIDSTLPSDFVYQENSRQLSLILPRHVVEQGLRFSGVRCAQRIPASAPVAVMANRLILESTRQDSLSLPESEATLDALVSLLRPALCSAEAEQDAHERLFRKTLRFIDEHICSEELCPEAIAREVGVSVRGLYRMFSRKGLVVAQYIKNRRLDFCAESLRHAAGEQKLSALGYAWGFTDSSYFSTAFKARFGVSPSEYRKQYSQG